MVGGTEWPVPVAAISPVRVGTVLWSISGSYHLTVIVKGRLALVPNGDMALTSAEPIVSVDGGASRGPASGVAAPREIAPQLGRVDVVLTGRAGGSSLAGAPSPDAMVTVRLALQRDGHRLIDKSLSMVAGDEVLPLGPLSPTDFQRRQLLGALDITQLEGLTPTIPAGLDWRFFQCAPPDQRLEPLRGDEWIELEGLTAEGRLRTRLPSLQGAARLYGLGPGRPPEPVPLALDMVRIDALHRTCALIWRGSIPLADPSVTSSLVAIGACSAPGQQLPWPDSIAAIAPGSYQRLSSDPMSPGADAGSAGPAPQPVVDLTGTAELSSPGPSQPATPFDGPAGRAAFSAPLASTAPAGAAAATGPDPAPAEEQGTHILTTDEVRSAQDGPAGPFDLARPDPAARPPEAPPGAPWSSAPPAPVPVSEQDLFETVRLDESPSPAPA
ncbi:MAG: DUF2169 domain-containing protein, partial [Deltaproteobacteria bacterium]|nr:DUF2169 domain-containing protein [Deltaproteobacteria bacterium]MBW2536233.1 DUF2169 domain-containing protein [Deltaproteobacteria bacterium]